MLSHDQLIDIFNTVDKELLEMYSPTFSSDTIKNNLADGNLLTLVMMTLVMKEYDTTKITPYSNADILLGIYIGVRYTQEIQKATEIEILNKLAEQ